MKGPSQAAKRPPRPTQGLLRPTEGRFRQERALSRLERALLWLIPRPSRQTQEPLGPKKNILILKEGPFKPTKGPLKPVKGLLVNTGPTQTY